MPCTTAAAVVHKDNRVAPAAAAFDPGAGAVLLLLLLLGSGDHGSRASGGRLAVASVCAAWMSIGHSMAMSAGLSQVLVKRERSSRVKLPAVSSVMIPAKSGKHSSMMIGRRAGSEAGCPITETLLDVKPAASVEWCGVSCVPATALGLM